MTFTVEEVNLICIYDTTNRVALIDGISAVMPDYEDDDMREIAENALRKLNSMSDSEFSETVFSPAYDGEEEKTSYEKSRGRWVNSFHQPYISPYSVHHKKAVGYSLNTNMD